MTIARWLGVAAPAGLLTIAGLVAASSGGCTVTAGGGGLDGGDFDGYIAPQDAGPQNCNQCLFQQCSSNWAACQNDTDCNAIYACATAPSCSGSQQCINACYCAHPAGQARYVALAACDSYFACETCQTTCPTLSTAAACTSPGVIQRDICGAPPVDAGVLPEDGGAADAAPPTEDASLPPTDASMVTDCTSCTADKCASEKGACSAGSDCEAFTLCIAACQDAACFDQCGAAHASGKTASQALENCTVTSCKTACGL